MELPLLAVTSLAALAATGWALLLRSRLREARAAGDGEKFPDPGDPRSLQELNRALLEMARKGAISEEGVRASLREITETAAGSLSVSRVGVWLFEDGDPPSILCIHQYDTEDGGHSRPDTLIPMSRAPSYFEAIRSSRIVDVDDARQDPRTAQLTDYLDDTGVIALLDAPIRIRGQIKGVVCHEHRSGPRPWTSAEKQFAASVGDLLSVVLEAAEHRKTRAELAEARSRTLQILDTVTDAFFHLDPRGRFTYLNPAAESWARRLGLDPEELLGQSIWSAVDVDPDNPGRRELTGAMESGQPVHYTRHSPVLDRWVDVHAYPSDDGLAVYLRDVTEQKEAEEALRDSEERFRHLVERAPEAIVVMDPEVPEILAMNQNMVELFEMPREELMGQFPPRMSPERQPDGRLSRVAAEEYIRKALEGEDQALEWVHLKGDGTEMLCEVRLTRLPWGDRSVVRASLTDISERKEAEKALRESEERYRMLFESDVAGNYVIGADGVIRNCNDVFARIFGWESAEDAVGTQVVPLIESQATRDAFLDELREHGSLRMRETEARRLDGSTVYVTENVRGVFDDDGELVEVRGHMIDITERRELEDQLRQAQKMEAVGQLAGGIAHDFNNLLTAVAGHADLLLIEDDTPEAVKEDVRKIKEAADRATSLTDQLLAFSRRQVLQSRVLDLNDVIRGMEQIMVRLIGEDIELDFDLGQVDPVRTDPNQVEQTLLNLAVNARDAMPAGGRIRVTTRDVSVDEDAASGPVDLEPGSYALLEFSDTGQGMPDEVREKIFEPFFTTKEPGKGTGLGLAMVYGFVHQTGGSLEVESQEGEGTRFRIYLPSAGESARTTAGAPPKDLGGSETVLLVDDEEAVRSLARKILEQKGYTVLSADHPRKALIHAEQWPEEVDLLLTDVVMPEMNGQALARRVLEHRPGIGVLYITGHTDLDLDPEGPAGSRGRLLTKPFSADELLGRIRETLDARERVGAEGAR